MFSIIILCKDVHVKIKLNPSFLEHSHQHVIKIQFNIAFFLTEFSNYLTLQTLLN